MEPEVGQASLGEELLEPPHHVTGAQRPADVDGEHQSVIPLLGAGQQPLVNLRSTRWNESRGPARCTRTGSRQALLPKVKGTCQFSLMSYLGCGLLSPQRASADQSLLVFSFLRVSTVINAAYGSNTSRLYCRGIPTACSRAGAPNAPAPTM